MKLGIAIVLLFGSALKDLCGQSGEVSQKIEKPSEPLIGKYVIVTPWGFEPSSITVPANTQFQLLVLDRSGLPDGHEFVIESDTVSPAGGAQRLVGTLSIKPGRREDALLLKLGQGQFQMRSNHSKFSTTSRFAIKTITK
jgi:hypothetical protein